MVQVRNVAIGEGRPKICASITETDRKSIVAAADILLQKRIDIIEWRIDFYKELNEWSMVEETLHRVRMSLGDKPLLVTFRTKQEGGNKEITIEEYRSLLLQIAQSGYVDMIDVEVFMEIPYTQWDPSVRTSEEAAALLAQQQWIAQLQQHVLVVGSYHDFAKTPSVEEMAGRLACIAKAGADIVKMAVMPQDKQDVIRLMGTTLEMSSKLTQPLITMSMGKLGSISRIIGEAFNCAATFGSVGQASAPGQIVVNRLDEALDLVHQNYY